jgi:hypothetical protein
MLNPQERLASKSGLALQESYSPLAQNRTGFGIGAVLCNMAGLSFELRYFPQSGEGSFLTIISSRRPDTSYQKCSPARR